MKNTKPESVPGASVTLTPATASLSVAIASRQVTSESIVVGEDVIAATSSGQTSVKPSLAILCDNLAILSYRTISVQYRPVAIMIGHHIAKLDNYRSIIAG